MKDEPTSANSSTEIHIALDIEPDEPLRRRTLAAIAPSLVYGPTFKRAELIEAAVQFNMESGRPPLDRPQIALMVKKALPILELRGIVTKTDTSGYWRWTLPDRSGDERTESFDSDGGKQERTHDIPSAEGAVYAYYYETYREAASRTSRGRWPMKVGMTSRSPVSIRIGEQQGSSMPERPRIAFTHRTANPRALEQVLHGVLTTRNRRVKEAIGNEWFWTTPAELEEITRWALNG